MGIDNQDPFQDQPTPYGIDTPADTGPTMEAEEVADHINSPDDAYALAMDDIPPDAPAYEEGKGKWILIVVIVLFFIIMFILLYIFLTSRSGGGNKEPTTITYWSTWEEKAIYEPLINEYQTKNPHVKIEFLQRDHNRYRDKLIAQARDPELSPDIFRYHNTWLPQIEEIADPMPETIYTENDFKNTFYPVALQDVKSAQDGKLYGIPLYIDGLILIYNNGLLQEAGFENPPNTWNDLSNYLDKLSAEDTTGELTLAPIALGSAENVEHFSDIFGTMLLQNNGDLNNLTSPNAQAALELYRSYEEEGFWSSAMPNSVTAFFEEKVAMIMAPSWQVIVIRRSNPNIDVKTAPIPQFPGGREAVLASYWIEGVSKQSDNKEEAWKFLKFLSERESQQKLYQAQTKIRLFGSPYSRVDLANELTNQDYVGTVIQQGPIYTSLPLTSRTYDDGMNEAIIGYIRNAINATANGVSYSEALSTANQGVTGVMQTYQDE